MVRRAGLFVLLFCFWGTCFLPSAYAQEKKLVMVFSSQMGDIQSLDQKGGLAELATLLENLRKDGSEVLFFHGGGAFGGFTLSAFDHGAHMVGLLNLLDPAAYALARNDFPRSKDTLSVRTHDAIFPFVSSNLVDSTTMGPVRGIKNNTIVHANTIPVGFFSLISTGLMNTHMAASLELLEQESVFFDEIWQLKRNGAILTVAASDFAYDEVSLFLDDGPNILFLTDEEATRIARHGETLVLHQRGESTAFVVTAIFADTHDDGNMKLRSLDAEIVDLATLPQNDFMASAMSDYAEVLDILLNSPVGHTEVLLETLETLLNSQENAFANLVADAMREYYGADIGVIHAGFIRGNAVYPADVQITRRDLQREFPVQDASEYVAMSGRAVELMLENALSEIEEPQKTGKFLHVSGLAFEFDPTAEKGSRVRKITVNGEPLDKRREYTLTISSYLGAGRNGFYMLKTSKRRYTEKPPQAVSEIVRNYIDRNSPIAPKVSGRIVQYKGSGAN